MAEESAKLRIPYIAAAQAQKHVTHNEAMTLLDTLVQLSVLDKDLTAPPAEPEEGDCYIVAGAGGTATGAWIGWEKRIARFIDGTWRSYLPGQGAGAGWLAWVLDEDAMYRFDGTGWELAGIEGPPGRDPGVLFEWDMGTTDADPGAGELRANNASLASATQLFISKTSRGGSNVAAFLASLDDSTSSSRKGILVLTRTSDEAQAVFDTGAVTDATGYVKLAVSNHAGATSFSADDPISLQFWPTGDAGGAGGFNDFEGEWDDETAYDALDVVSFQGSSYVSKADSNLDNQPDESPGAWQLLAEKGEPGNDGTDGNDGADGSNGADGNDGADGTDPGILLNWDTGTSDADPGVGKIRANHASLASATELFISKTSRGGSDIAAFLAALDDSTNTAKGTLILTDSATEAQAAFVAGAVTDATGYVKLAVSGHAGATSFTNAAPVSFQFARAGDKGADGEGSGDVVGPEGATDGRFALFDGATGKLLKQHSGAPGALAVKNTIATADIDNNAVTYAKMQDVSATDKLLGRASAGSGDPEEIACTAAGRALLADANAAAQRATLGLAADAIVFVIDGGGSAITTGVKGDLLIPFACTIAKATLLANQSGSIVIDVWNDSYANFPPTDADSITASAPPTISAAVKSQDATLTGWSKSIAAGDILRFNVDSVSSIQRCTLVLEVTK